MPRWAHSQDADATLWTVPHDKVRAVSATAGKSHMLVRVLVAARF